MRFMIIRKADQHTEGDDTPTEQLIVAMERYIEEMTKAGIMLAGEGLHPSRKGARIKFSSGKPHITDGPFAETKELVAGFTIIDVRSREEALEWCKRWPQIDGGGEVELELRQVYEASDFGAEATPELGEVGELMREHLIKSGKPLGTKL
ncbi:MAG: YciI family protein [Pseudomonadota bacterium]